MTTATSASAAPSPAIFLRVLRSTLNTIEPHSAALRGERQQGMATLRLRRGCNGLEDEQAGETRLTDKSCKTSFRFPPLFRTSSFNRYNRHLRLHCAVPCHLFTCSPFHSKHDSAPLRCASGRAATCPILGQVIFVLYVLGYTCLGG